MQKRKLSATFTTDYFYFMDIFLSNFPQKKPSYFRSLASIYAKRTEISLLNTVG